MAKQHKNQAGSQKWIKELGGALETILDPNHVYADPKTCRHPQFMAQVNNVPPIDGRRVAHLTIRCQDCNAPATINVDGYARDRIAFVYRYPEETPDAVPRNA